MLSDGKPAQLAADAGLEDVVLPARFPYTDAEAGEFAVPVDGIGAACLEGLDGALREFGDAVCHGSSFLTSELALTSRFSTQRHSSRLVLRDPLQRRYRVQPPLTRAARLELWVRQESGRSARIPVTVPDAGGGQFQGLGRCPRRRARRPVACLMSSP